MNSEDEPTFTDADADAYMQAQADDWYMVIDALNAMDTPRLEELTSTFEGFPNGVDPWLGGHWINHAISSVEYSGVMWLIEQGVSLNIKDIGYTPLHSCLEREIGSKHLILKALISAGADVNAEGIYGYTPLHKAAVHSDLRAIDILLDAGADPNLQKTIDNYTTPEGEARLLGKTKVADYLKEKMVAIPPKPRRFEGPFGLADPKPLD